MNPHLQPHLQPRDVGWIEVITGSMFSGKSEELIRRIRRVQIARQAVQVFKPLIDNRYSDDHIVSHSDMRIASTNVRTSDDIIAQVADDTEVVGIDEGQFFDHELPLLPQTATLVTIFGGGNDANALPPSRQDRKSVV